MIQTIVPPKKSIVRVLPDCHWELKRYFNQWGFVCKANTQQARVMLADGNVLDLPLDYFVVISEADESAFDLIFRLSELWHSEYLDDGMVVIEILNQIKSRPYPKINELEDCFLSVLEDYIDWKKSSYD